MTTYYLCIYDNKVVNRIVCEDNPSPEFLESIRTMGFQNPDGTIQPYDLVMRSPSQDPRATAGPGNPQLGYTYDPNTHRFAEAELPPPPENTEQAIDRLDETAQRLLNWVQQIANRTGTPEPAPQVDDGTDSRP